VVVIVVVGLVCCWRQISNFSEIFAALLVRAPGHRHVTLENPASIFCFGSWCSENRVVRALVSLPSIIIIALLLMKDSYFKATIM
jgi:hypothetical protein